MLEVMRRQRAQKSTDEENKAVVEAANFLDDTLEVFSLSNHHLLLRVKKAGVVVTRISYILDWSLSKQSRLCNSHVLLNSCWHDRVPLTLKLSFVSAQG